MARSSRRPPVRPIVVVYTLGWVGFRAVLSAGALTALLVAIARPAAAVWIPTWIVLTAAWMILDMYQTLPDWFAWFRGRPPRGQRSDSD
jgi:hypothetical protein